MIKYINLYSCDSVVHILFQQSNKNGGIGGNSLGGCLDRNGAGRIKFKNNCLGYGRNFSNFRSSHHLSLPDNSNGSGHHKVGSDVHQRCQVTNIIKEIIKIYISCK